MLSQRVKKVFSPRRLRRATGAPPRAGFRIHLRNKIKQQHLAMLLFGGGRWIRTTESTANRFTVCPLWPLGNSPICMITVRPQARRTGNIQPADNRTRTDNLLITNHFPGIFYAIYFYLSLCILLILGISLFFYMVFSCIITRKICCHIIFSPPSVGRRLHDK